MRLTAAGHKIAPPPPIPLTNQALQDAVRLRIPPAACRLLNALIGAYPRELSLEDLAQQAKTTTASSAFITNRSWLRARGLAEYPRAGFVQATKLLFPEGP
jgi:hypothetical protein